MVTASGAARRARCARRWLQTLCAFRLGERNRIRMPLALSVAGQVQPRILLIRGQWIAPDAVGLRPILSCQGRDASQPVRAVKLVRPRAPSIDSIPDMTAGPSSRALAVCSRAMAPHPCCPKRSRSQSRGAGDPCYPSQPRPFGQGYRNPRPFRQRPLGKMRLTDFCNRPPARAPDEPLDSHAGEVPCSTLGAGGDAFDAVPPASIVRSTLSSRSAWRGAPHREGCFAAAALSAAGSARRPTSDTPYVPDRTSRDG